MAYHTFELHQSSTKEHAGVTEGILFACEENKPGYCVILGDSLRLTAPA